MVLSNVGSHSYRVALEVQGSFGCLWCSVLKVMGSVWCFGECTAATGHLEQYYCPIWISPMGKSVCVPRGKPTVTEWCYSTCGACWVFQCFHHQPAMVDTIFNVRTYVSACNCTRGCTDTVRESALKVDSGTKGPYRTGESNRLSGEPV